MGRVVQQINAVVQAIERELTKLFTDRKVPFNALELRIFCLSIVLASREVTARRGVAPLQAELIAQALDGVVLAQLVKGGFVISQDARMQFGNDVAALFKGRLEEYRRKLAVDIKKRGIVPGSKVQWGAISQTAADCVFETRTDRLEKAGWFANRMETFFEICQANLPVPEADALESPFS